MLHVLSRFRVPIVVCALLFTDSPLAAAGQQPAPPEPLPPVLHEMRGAATPARQAQVVVAGDQDARETREAFEALLRRLPPSVGGVMRIDPSLMRNESYLAGYPTLNAFLQQHPDVVQNPSYYLEHVEAGFDRPRQPEDARMQGIRLFEEMMQGLAIMFVISTVAFSLLWIIRTLVEYRRWYRTSKVQTEVHTKLLDRFTANEDLMAYMQTPAGRRFLESAPIAVEGPARSMGAPLSRILWSLQAGVVLAVAALGILFVSGQVIEEISQPLFAAGVLVLALGSGFVVSAGASFLLSRRLGLLDPPPGAREQTGVSGA